MQAKHFIMSAVILIVGLQAQFAQNATESGEPIELIWADEMAGSSVGGEKIREVSGSVHFRQGNVDIYCDRAIEFLDRNAADLVGSVVITQNDMTLWSPKIRYEGDPGTAETESGVKIRDSAATLVAARGKYYTKTKFVEFAGDVKIVQDDVTLTADELRYDRNTRFSTATGSVLFEDDSTLIVSEFVRHDRNSGDSRSYGDVHAKMKYESAYLLCDTLLHFGRTDFNAAYGRPRLFRIDSTARKNAPSEIVDSTENLDSALAFARRSFYDFDTLTVVSDTMESTGSSESIKYLFRGNVELSRVDVFAFAGLAELDESAERLDFYENPIMLFDSTRLYGDSIFVTLVDDKLNNIESRKNAFVASRDDTLYLDRINQIQASVIEIVFESDSLKQIKGFGDSKSLYFSDAREDGGAVRKSSDEIIIKFGSEGPEEIVWLESVEGEFYPENLTLGREEELYLPEFRFTEEKPEKRYLRFEEKMRTLPERKKPAFLKSIEK